MTEELRIDLGSEDKPTVESLNGVSTDGEVGKNSSVETVMPHPLTAAGEVFAIGVSQWTHEQWEQAEAALERLMNGNPASFNG